MLDQAAPLQGWPSTQMNTIRICVLPVLVVRICSTNDGAYGGSWDRSIGRIIDRFLIAVP